MSTNPSIKLAQSEASIDMAQTNVASLEGAMEAAIGAKGVAQADLSAESSEATSSKAEIAKAKLAIQKAQISLNTAEMNAEQANLLKDELEPTDPNYGAVLSASLSAQTAVNNQKSELDKAELDLADAEARNEQSNAGKESAQQQVASAQGDEDAIRRDSTLEKALAGFWRNESSFWRQEINENKTAVKDGNKLAQAA